MNSYALILKQFGPILKKDQKGLNMGKMKKWTIFEKISHS